MTVDRSSCAPAHLATLLVALAVASPASAQSTRSREAASTAMRDFAAHEAAGLHFGQIHVRTEDVFDTSDPRENYALFRLANRVHVHTRPWVVERALLFAPGDKVTVHAVEETERLLRANRHLYDVQIRPLEPHDGVVDVEVATRDSWSLEVGTFVSSGGGTDSSGIRVAEYNLLGTGATFTVARRNGVDRSSTSFGILDNRAFGTWTRVAVSHADNSDGRRSAFEVARPFHALDARRAAGVSAVHDDRIDAVYRAGKVASQYRVRQRYGEAFAGWSAGLRDGWVQRWSAGVSMQDDAFAPEPDRAAPAALPPGRRLRAPFVRWSLVEDRIDRQSNHDLMGRPEYFVKGLVSSVQLGRTLGALGSTHDAWIYALSLQRGFEPAHGQTLMVSAHASGQQVDGTAQRVRVGFDARWYVPQSARRLLYAAGSVQWLERPDPAGGLRLGAEDGLRGYPLRWQVGTRRAMFTLEQRWYSDLFVWRLFRIGGAAFLDVGRAWGGDASGATARPPWLSNVGAGLRIVSARSAFGNVLHIDVAAPLGGRGDDVDRVQLLVSTKASF